MPQGLTRRGSDYSPDVEEGKAAGGRAGDAAPLGESSSGPARVSFLTAALMGVALCFHSILEVRWTASYLLSGGVHTTGCPW